MSNLGGSVDHLVEICMLCSKFKLRETCLLLQLREGCWHLLKIEYIAYLKLILEIGYIPLEEIRFIYIHFKSR